MIEANNKKLTVNGTVDEVIPEFLAVYKVLESKFKEEGKKRFLMRI